jgi:hypothetical protein
LVPAGSRDVDGLPYQLLTATAGVLALADRERAVAALLLIHEFANGVRADGRPSTDPQRLRKNAAQINTFLRSLSAGRVSSLESDSIIGPFTVPNAGSSWRSVPLYFGKLTTDLGRRSPIPSAR